MEQPIRNPVPEAQVAACAATALTLVYSAPTPGAGSRYVDGRVAHESRLLSVVPARDAVRFAAARDALAREYARNFEVSLELGRPALLASLSRCDSVRGALLQAY